MATKVISGLVGLASLAAGAETVTMEDKAYFTAKVVQECKGDFLNAITTLYPDDLPGQAFDALTLACLKYTDFLPRKWNKSMQDKSHYLA